MPTINDFLHIHFFQGHRAQDQGNGQRKLLKQDRIELHAPTAPLQSPIHVLGKHVLNSLDLWHTD